MKSGPGNHQHDCSPTFLQSGVCKKGHKDHLLVTLSFWMLVSEWFLVWSLNFFPPNSTGKKYCSTEQYQPLLQHRLADVKVLDILLALYFYKVPKTAAKQISTSQGLPWEKLGLVQQQDGELGTVPKRNTIKFMPLFTFLLGRFSWIWWKVVWAFAMGQNHLPRKGTVKSRRELWRREGIYVELIIVLGAWTWRSHEALAPLKQ